MGHGEGAPSVQDEVVIGVLALQGAFAEHIHLFKKLNVKAVEVRTPEELETVHALVLPGGESTAISLLARRWGLIEPLREWVKNGKPIWGTCAGMILLANNLTGKMKEGQEVIGGFEATVHRNYFGSQLGSFSTPLRSKLGETDSEYVGVFIRAPVIVNHSENVQVLATVHPHRTSSEASEHIEQEEPIVAAKQHNILVTSFHPELTQDAKWHAFFHEMVIQLLKPAAV